MLGEYDFGILGKQLKLPGAVELLLRFGPRCCHLMEGLVDVLGKVLFVDDILLLLGEDINLIFGIFEPGVAQYLNGAESFPRVNREKRVDQVSGMLGKLGGRLLWLGSCRSLAILVLLEGIWVIDVILAVDDQMMQLLHT